MRLNTEQEIQNEGTNIHNKLNANSNIDNTIEFIDKLLFLCQLNIHVS